MKRYITPKNLSDYIVTNENHVKHPIKALAVEFPGFDGNSCLSGNFNFPELSNGFAKELAENGVLLIYVLTGPWNWMREASVLTTDDIIESAIEKYGLLSNIPLIFTGGSMGGHGALAYARYGKFKPNACAVSCPVCDLFETAKFSKAFCASVYFACAYQSENYEDEVRRLSPLYFANELPKIPYLYIACRKDTVIPYETNAKPMLEKMKQAGYSVEVLDLPDAGHCEHTQNDIKALTDFIISFTDK